MRNHFQTLLCGAAVAIGCGLAVLPARAQDSIGGSVGGDAKGVCLQAHLVDRTEIVDARTILFHMIGGKTWKNTLASPCPTMTRADGIAYETSVDRLCSNLEIFRVLRTGESCLLGEFTPVERPVKLPVR